MPGQDSLLSDQNETRSYLNAFTYMQWSRNPEALPLGFEVYGGIGSLLDRHHAFMILINAPSFGGCAPRYFILTFYVMLTAIMNKITAFIVKQRKK